MPCMRTARPSDLHYDSEAKPGAQTYSNSGSTLDQASSTSILDHLLNVSWSHDSWSNDLQTSAVQFQEVLKGCRVSKLLGANSVTKGGLPGDAFLQ